MMTVYDFCNLCTEPRITNVNIYDLNANSAAGGDVVFQGAMDDACASKYSDCDVYSFDLNDEGLTLNVDTSEE